MNSVNVVCDKFVNSMTFLAVLIEDHFMTSTSVMMTFLTSTTNCHPRTEEKFRIDLQVKKKVCWHDSLRLSIKYLSQINYCVNYVDLHDFAYQAFPFFSCIR